MKNIRQERLKLALLIAGNALFALCGVLTALFSKNIIDAAQNRDRGGLIRFGGVLLGLIFIQTALKMLCRSLEVRIQSGVEIRLRGRLFSQILKKDYRTVTACHSGELMTKLTSDVSVVAGGVTSILPSAAAMATRLTAAFAVLLTLDRSFTLILAAAGLLLFLFTRIFRGMMKRLHKRVQETDGRVRAFMQETIENLLVVKVFGVDGKLERASDSLQKDYYDAVLTRNRWSVFANIGFSMAFSFGYLFAILWSGFRLCAGTISFGTLTAVIQLVNQVQVPFTGLSGLMPLYYSVLASAERLIEIENMPESRTLNPPDLDIKALGEDFSSIRFSDVSFDYGRETVLKDVSFEIKKNDFVLISGISGIGKTTLLELMVGVLTPEEGEIRLRFGEKTCAVDRYTRPLFAYVPQGNMLMSGTIRDNIRLVVEAASDDEIMEAARLSCADGFIRELPEGLDTVLTESGGGLSEGQLQRLAVARAVLSGAQVLLLDEATSALDERTEAQLLKNIRGLKDKTCIIISHKRAARSICSRELKISGKRVTVKALK